MVDDFDTNQKRVYDFLLVRHCDYGPILHRFWDTASYWLKIAYFSYPSHSAPMFPLEFRGEVMGLSSSEDPMILAGVVLAWYLRVTDGRTIGRTESIIA